MERRRELNNIDLPICERESEGLCYSSLYIHLQREEASEVSESE